MPDLYYPTLFSSPKADSKCLKKNKESSSAYFLISSNEYPVFRVDLHFLRIVQSDLFKLTWLFKTGSPFVPYKTSLWGGEHPRVSIIQSHYSQHRTLVLSLHSGTSTDVEIIHVRGRLHTSNFFLSGRASHRGRLASAWSCSSSLAHTCGTERFQAVQRGQSQSQEAFTHTVRTLLVGWHGRTILLLSPLSPECFQSD